MFWTVLLIIFAVLAVILLLPIRDRGGYAAGAWHVTVTYAFFKLFHKESAEKPPQLTPPKPDEDITEGQITEIEPVDSVSAQNAAQEAEPEPEPEPEPEDEPESPEPVHEEPKPDTAPKPDTKPEEDTADDSAEDPNDLFTEEEEPEKPEKPKKMNYIRWLKPHSLHDILGLVGDGCATLSPGMRSITKHLRFRHVNLRLIVSTDDAAKTAKTYGAICAAFSNLHAQLCCVFDIEADSLRILADYERESFDFEGSMEIRVSPMALIAILLVFGFKFLSVSYPRYRRERKEAKLIAEETTPVPAE